jgi:hypothetical protein
MPRPVVTLDIDGVLARPPFGINPGRGIGKSRDKHGKWNLAWPLERWRYRGRRLMNGVGPGWQELAETYDCRVVSARGQAALGATQAWFEEQLGFVPEIHLRPHWRETSAQFKARKVTELGSVAHFEDDPHTAKWLSELIPAVFLVDWPRNRWLDGPRITRIHRLGQARLELESVTRALREGAPGEPETG